MSTEPTPVPRRGFVTRTFRGIGVGIREFDLFTIAGLLSLMAIVFGVVSQSASRFKAQWDILPASGTAWTTSIQRAPTYEPAGYSGEPQLAGRYIDTLTRVEISGRMRNGKFVQVRLPADGNVSSFTALLGANLIVLKDPAPRLTPQSGAIFGGTPGRNLTLLAAPSDYARQIGSIPYNQVLLLRANVEARAPTPDLPPIEPGWKLVENTGPQGKPGQFYVRESAIVAAPAWMRAGTLSPGLAGTWQGGGQCIVAGRFSLTVAITETPSGISLRAIVQRQGEQAGRSPSYRQTATFDPRTRRLAISSPSWEQRPVYYLPMGSIDAAVSADWQSMNGKINDPTCGQLELVRTQ